mmetsp:Transcript_176/g.335  ORF Transcript_176/g.335 Transcript_176/m.335 type:complete len:280 (-) Transcript_176:705-1544(-)
MPQYFHPRPDHQCGQLNRFQCWPLILDVKTDLIYTATCAPTKELTRSGKMSCHHEPSQCPLCLCFPDSLDHRHQELVEMEEACDTADPCPCLTLGASLPEPPWHRLECLTRRQEAPASAKAWPNSHDDCESREADLTSRICFLIERCDVRRHPSHSTSLAGTRPGRWRSASCHGLQTLSSSAAADIWPAPRSQNLASRQKVTASQSKEMDRLTSLVEILGVGNVQLDSEMKIGESFEVPCPILLIRTPCGAAAAAAARAAPRPSDCPPARARLETRQAD